MRRRMNAQRHPGISVARLLAVGMMAGLLTLLEPTRAVAQAGAAAGQLPPEVIAYADTILTNGKVLTVDKDFSVREALAIRDGKVLAVDTTAAIQRYAGPRTQRIDLAGKTVIPGIIDTHLHLHEGAPGRFKADFEANEPLYREYMNTARAAGNTIPEVLASLKTIVATRRPGSWVHAEIINEKVREPFSQQVHIPDLNAVAPNNPLVVSTIGWLNLANQNAIEEMRKYYGYVGEDLEKKGVADVAAMRGITGDIIIQNPMQSLYSPFVKEMKRYATYGVTTWSSSMTPVSYLPVFHAIDDNKEMPIRFAFSQTVGVTSFPHAGGFYQRLGNITGWGTDYLWAAGAGVTVSDGPPEEACTTLDKAHEKPCFVEAPDAEKGKAMYALVKAGNRITGTHTSGDRSADQVMDIIEKASAEAHMTPEQIRAKAHTIDHCRMYPRPDQIERGKRLGIIWNCAPDSIDSVAPMLAAKYGEEYAQRWVVPVGSIIRAGGKVAGHGEGVDGDSYFTNPEMLMTRTDSKGKVWGKDEAIDRKDVLRMYTIWAAEYVAKPDRLGSLEPGKFADLVVLDKDYMTVPAGQFSDIHALLTMVGGKTVFQAPTFK